MRKPQSWGPGAAPRPAGTTEPPLTLTGHNAQFIIQNDRLSIFFPGQSNYLQTHLFDFSVKEIFSLKLFSLKKPQASWSTR